MRRRACRGATPLAVALWVLTAGACTTSYTEDEIDAVQDHPREERGPVCARGDLGCGAESAACLDDPDLCGPPAR